MLWRRRNEGFDWQTYVRTTVLARRQARRERIADAKEAALEGLKAAGRKGLEAGAEGAKIAGAGLEAGVKQLAELPGQALAAAAPHVERLHRASSSKLAPHVAWIGRPRAWYALIGIGGVAGLLGAVRAARFGLDVDAVVSLSVASLAVLLIVLHRYAEPREAGSSTALIAALRQRFARPQRPADDVSETRRTSEGGGATVVSGPVALGLGAAAVIAALLAWYALPSSSPQPSSDASASAETGGGADAPQQEGETGATSLTGPAFVVGPGTLRIAGKVVALDGIDMLAPHQTCRREDGRSWRCGAEARSALQRLVRGKRLACEERSTNADGTPTVRCLAGEKDLAALFVREGHAFAAGTFLPTYRSEEAAARAAGSGVWAGVAERSEDWRRRLWTEASAAAPDGCPIKGTIKGRLHVFVLPDAQDYARIRVDTERGGRWFCSEEEALAAGFRHRGKGPSK